MGNPSETIQWKKHVPLLGVLLLLFSAGPYVNRLPWFDESLTMDWLLFPFYQIPFRYTIPNNHIFYTVCLSLWNSLLNVLNLHNFYFMRILSLLFGACAVWLIARRLNRAGGIFAALPVLLLFAASGPMILFSTALRGYMPSMLFVFAAFLSAESWMKQKKRKDLLFYFVFCYLSVLTIPTNILSLGAGLLFLLPIGFRSRNEFFRLFRLGILALAAMLCAYLPIWQKFLNVARIKEGWYSYPDFLWNYYGTFLFVFFPLLVFCMIGIFRLPLKKYLKWRMICFAGILVLPMLLGFLFQTAPFPRVFFPLTGLFVLILSYTMSGYLRRRKGVLQKLPLLVSVIWMLAMPHLTPLASVKMFQAHYKDDLLLPYPISVSFRPHKVMQLIESGYVQGRMPHLYVDFDADPPSISFLLLRSNVPFEVLLRDHPRKGPVQNLPPGTWIVCRDEENFNKVRKRFQLQENYRMLEETSGLYQKIYVPE
ncbi:MAG: hypothetical protein IKB25_04820 [Lentisphaeria bacterium]|nr:hypothetical protein [Lentisphaeria bacterium]